MHLDALHDAVLADPDLTFHALTDTHITIRSSDGFATALPVADLLKAPWRRIRAVCKGEDSGVAVHHMSRVVGYFSRIESWNPSKIGELRDRRLGSYRLREPGLAGRQAAG